MQNKLWILLFKWRCISSHKNAQTPCRSSEVRCCEYTSWPPRCNLKFLVGSVIKLPICDLIRIVTVNLLNLWCIPKVDNFDSLTKLIVNQNFFRWMSSTINYHVTTIYLWAVLETCLCLVFCLMYLNQF